MVVPYQPSLLLLVLCALLATSNLSIVKATCPVFATLHAKASTLVTGDQDEISGIAVSTTLTHTSGPVVWALSDSGGPTQVAAFGVNNGARLATLDVSDGVPAGHDMEDLALGPCNGANNAPTCLFVGETGNNAARKGKGTGGRTTVSIYRFTEPSTLGDMKPTMDKINFSYDQAGITSADCETLMIDPLTGDIFLVTKWNAAEQALARIFKIPSGTPNNSNLALKPLLASNSALVTNKWVGGDISKDGLMIAMRNVDKSYLWTRGPNESVEEALNREPCREWNKPPSGAQHEAIAFGGLGSNQLVEISEGANADAWLTTFATGNTQTSGPTISSNTQTGTPTAAAIGNTKTASPTFRDNTRTASPTISGTTTVPNVDGATPCECRATAGDFESCVLNGSESTACLIKQGGSDKSTSPKCTPPSNALALYSDNYNGWFVYGCSIAPGTVEKTTPVIPLIGVEGGGSPNYAMIGGVCAGAVGMFAVAGVMVRRSRKVDGTLLPMDNINSESHGGQQQQPFYSNSGMKSGNPMFTNY